MESPNPFEAHRRKTRRRLVQVLTIGGFLAALVVSGGIGFSRYRDPDRLVAKERPWFEATKTKLCALAEKEKRTEDPPPTPPGKPVKSLGWFSLTMDAISHPNADGNLDDIETSELEALCRGEQSSSRSFHSLFTEVFEPNKRVTSGRELAAVRRALTTLKQLEFMLVVRVDTFVPSTSTGPGTMSPGRYKARATLYRIADAAIVDTVVVDERAPGFASVLTLRSANGADLVDTDSSLAASTSTALQEAVVREFAKRGIEFKIE